VGRRGRRFLGFPKRGERKEALVGCGKLTLLLGRQEGGSPSEKRGRKIYWGRRKKKTHCCAYSNGTLRNARIVCRGRTKNGEAALLPASPAGENQRKKDQTTEEARAREKREGIEKL